MECTGLLSPPDWCLTTFKHGAASFLCLSSWGSLRTRALFVLNLPLQMFDNDSFGLELRLKCSTTIPELGNLCIPGFDGGPCHVAPASEAFGSLGVPRKRCLEIDFCC